MSERASMDTDIVCVGFGPAAGGFLTTLMSKVGELASTPQIMCCERADGLAFGVSGAVTRARAIRQSFPSLDPAVIPMAAQVREEKLVYLLDPIGASRRSIALRSIDAVLPAARPRDHAVELQYTPAFLHKNDGLVLSIGQFNQWVGEQLMSSGVVQIWPSMPVAEPLVENNAVVGVRLADRDGEAGMDIRAALTVVADGPVGAVGRALDRRFGAPPEFERNEWAAGCKMVIDLPADSPLEAGAVIHTLGFPEPEIFGFLYVHPGRVASAGIFVPSFLRSPVRTSYRYLQHFIQHPYLWRWLRGGRMRSWGAKSLLESGLRGEPWLAGNGYARIGEGSGSTNVLTGSGVDEAWATGIQLAEGVVELMRGNAPFTRENLERAYIARRRESWVDREGHIAENARNGFETGFLTGLLGMALAAMTKGSASVHRQVRHAVSPARHFRGRISPEEFRVIQTRASASAAPLHDAIMSRLGWPEIEYDGALLMSHQDALLTGGKVQGAAGFGDHVSFRNAERCAACGVQLCVEMCSGQAITPAGESRAPVFDREKCVHCGACLWNCPHGNIDFRAGGGGLHSAEN